MKILLDTCVWGGVRQVLENAGYDVIWAGDWEKDPGDEEILAWANNENRVLITLDKDFGELVIVRELPHAGIIRLANLSARDQGVYCLHTLRLYEKDISEKAILTVERRRVRVRTAM